MARWAKASPLDKPSPRPPVDLMHCASKSLCSASKSVEQQRATLVPKLSGRDSDGSERGAPQISGRDSDGSEGGEPVQQVHLRE